LRDLIGGCSGVATGSGRDAGSNDSWKGVDHPDATPPLSSS
jgi:hypothetical protein